MKSDFTRDTFDTAKHFSRVLMQQGRVTLDADHNEQTAIQLHYLRTLAKDLIGPYAAPAGPEGGFVLADSNPGIFSISKGRYYVDGILVENDTDNCTYTTQPDLPQLPDDPLVKAANANAAAQPFWIYLDVWERHITPIEDDSIREKALDGPDTCTRAKIVWQVKGLPLTPDLVKNLTAAEQKLTAQLNDLWTKKASLEKQFQNAAATDTATQISVLQQIHTLDGQLEPLLRWTLLPVHELLLAQLPRLSNATLAARVDPGIKIEDACVTAPDSKYRGTENQLYRVEIHHGGQVGEATFKWSRDNGSAATSWTGGDGSEMQVTCTRGFAAGNWVELSDDNTDLLGNPGVLVKLAKVEGNTLTADASGSQPNIVNFPNHPKIRRWDQIATDAAQLTDGAMPIQESAVGADLWIDLEDGVQIKFSPGGEYRTGDYWLIPARVATGAVEWPQADDLNPQPLPPRGIEHHYALLGFATRAQETNSIQSVRCEFSPIFECKDRATLQQKNKDNVLPIVAPFKTVQPGKKASPRKRARKARG